MYQQHDLWAPPPPVTPGRRGSSWTSKVGLLVAGAAAGGIIAFAINAGATNQAPASSSGSTSTTAPGTFHSNEDPTHEKGESAQREAQENAGQFPTVP
jgi:hypothetical protein